MTTVTGAPSASPYPKDLNEDCGSSPCTVIDVAASLEADISRLASMLYAIDQAVEESQHADTAVAAIGRAMDFVCIAQGVAVGASSLVDRLYRLGWEAGNA